MGYIVQYNKCGLRCEGSEDIADERRENLHFRPPHSHLKPPRQRTPPNNPHTSYLARNSDPWATFSSLTVWVYLHSNFFVVGSERHVCNTTERIIAVQGQLRVIQGRWLWYQSKARTWFHISDQLQPWSYVAPFRRYGGLLVEKSPKSPVRTHQSQKSPSLGVTPIEFRDEPDISRN